MLTSPGDEAERQLFVRGHDDIHAPIFALHGDVKPYHPVMPTSGNESFCC